MTMTIDDKMPSDNMLDDTFAVMAASAVQPSEALLNAIMMDADSVLAVPITPRARAKSSFGAMILDVIGGWPSFSGLAAATVAGLWIGVSPPAAISDISAGYLGSTVEIQLLNDDIFAGLDL